MGFLTKLKQRIFNNSKTTYLNKETQKVNTYVSGLNKSNNSFTHLIKEMENKYNKIDEEYFEHLEEILIMSDISMKLVNIIIQEIKKEVKIENIKDPKLIREIIADKLFTLYISNSTVDTSLDIQKGRLNVILVVGVNGGGKTTSVAKLAHNFQQQGLKTLVVAADTFRQAAVEQLEEWANKVHFNLFKPLENETDPSAVVFRSCDEAINKKYDILLIDTAGRLQNKVNLMNELAKIKRIISSKIENAPHESLLVVDATTGQNGISQAKLFNEITDLSGIILTKMDGTSKGGIILTIRDEIGINVKYVGLGEKVDDLVEFDLDAFIFALMKDDNDK
ncbi:signal recognition particle-docking protein FtsY [Mycoplasma miroungirhinis]|uniref:Signal recognition particle receptor FtsY n=1 Tax=Mycoplasma miroungirhinis TaxID=754516 RepID=A0A6M4JD85_9MOLU|nr:signal recognition particle-docking protein FtsY [Mycoplasma miroungirhinis]QJR44295.1 signal recognition particle-docking protein FtsY [Mycoplasma miroungirhinis]